MPRGVYLHQKKSKETKAKMSKAHLGKNTWSKGSKRSEEFKNKISEYQTIHDNSGRFKKGQKVSKETRKKMSLNRKGKKLSDYHVKRIRETIKKGYEAYKWKGDDVKYSGLHNWIRKKLGSPHYCEHCGNIELNYRQYHWANKGGKYKRKLDDWIRLCVSCHRKYDIKMKKLLGNIKRLCQIT